MNYRHAFHAGSFADVIKHAVLARILVHLEQKPAAYRMLDTHAGAGLYDLTGDEASRTGEWRDGIARIRQATLSRRSADFLQPYLARVNQFNAEGDLRRYPGSPLLALTAMRAQDRLIACELEPGAFTELRRNLGRDKRAKAIAIDGWTALTAYVPPRERRGLVVIDPPFERKDDFDRLSGGLITAHRKWPTGTYLAWFPIKDLSGPDALERTLREARIGKVYRIELSVAPVQRESKLTAAGLVVVNPPWTLPEELTSVMPEIATILGRGRGSHRVEWIAK